MQTVLKHTVEYRLGVPELTLTSDAHDTRYIRSRAHGSSLQTTREKERERESCSRCLERVKVATSKMIAAQF